MAAETTDPHAEGATIERDIERTQDQMGQTVQKLEEKLTPREMARSVMGEEGTDFAREALELARQNPIPVAMIAVGAIWLLATSRSPVVKRMTSRIWERSGSGDSRLRRSYAELSPIGPAPSTDESLDRPLGR